MHSRPRSFQTMRVVAIAATIIVASVTLTAGPAVATQSGTLPKPQLGKPVPGKPAAKLHVTASSSRSVANVVSKNPAAGSYHVQTPTATEQTPAALAKLHSGNLAGTWKGIGTTGVDIAPLTAATATDHPVTALTARVLSAPQLKAAGLSGVAIELSRTDTSAGPAHIAVRIPQKLLAGLYGADYASRLRWVEIPVANSPTHATTASPAGAQRLSSQADSGTQSMLLAPMIGATPMVIAATTTPVSATGTGSFAATPLNASTAWDVSAQTGDFSWSYPLRVPPAAAGPSPDLALAYDSQSVDGETGSSNNQPSAVGEGWSLSGTGFIERTYVSCSLDDTAPVSTSGDLCWKTSNATLSLGGHSGTLVNTGTNGIWKLQNDDGTRIQLLSGTSGCVNGDNDNECWVVTTTDGTQYYFGRNELPGWATGKPVTNSTWTVPVFGNSTGEPCHAATFAASSCTQGWRWNLDYVVDTHQNAEAIYYTAETNKYAINASTTASASYIRGGQVGHIDYGIVNNAPYVANAATGRVTMGYAANGRCNATSGCTAEPLASAATHPTTAANYPDVPWDQYCTTTTCVGKVSPTFWTDAELSTVTTQVLVSGVATSVDVWTLSHSFPAPGDGTNAALWLTRINHHGVTATATEPPTIITGATMQNRVWAVDGLAPLDKYRISSIKTSLGAIISVHYSAQQCTPANAATIEANPQTNTKRCFPQWWSPNVVPAQAPQEDLFHKYVVTSVISNPVTGGGNDQAQETDYAYTGTPAWRYDTSPFTPVNRRTWSVYAGYNAIEIRTGAASAPATQQTTQYTFFQGMDGDRATAAGGSKAVFVTGSTTIHDSLQFAGQTRDTKQLDGAGGSVLSDTVSTPVSSAATATDGTTKAYIVSDGDDVATQTNADGTTRTTHTTTTYDTNGNPLTQQVATPDAGTTCTITAYAAPNTTAWIIGLPAHMSTFATTCAAAQVTDPAPAISENETYYDSAALAAAPTKGDVTKTTEVDSYTGTTESSAHWATSSQTTFDTMGRPLQSIDVLGHTSTVSYVPATKGPLTASTSTNTAPFSWATTTHFDPKWGVETSVVDQNNKTTSATYDDLGRRIGVWLTDRPQATNSTSPSIGYAYSESQTAANYVTTKTIADSTTLSSFDIYDGLGREVQNQTAAEGSGATITDTAYNPAGQVAFTDAPYWTTSVAGPTGTLFVPTALTQIPSMTTTQYDGAGRTTATILSSYGAERYRTTTAYPGADEIDVTPPSGGTPTSTFSNTLGHTTKLIQYLAATPAATATKETTSYTYNPQGSMTSMTDPAGDLWSWSFDVLGHQVSATDPDTGTTTSTWDDAGDHLTSTDARGITLAETYDNLQRVTGEYNGTTPATGGLLASWSYDTLAKGQATASSSYTGSTPGHPGLAYTQTIEGYDDGYRPTGSIVSIPVGAPAFSGTSYETDLYYNRAGQIQEEDLPAEGGLDAEGLVTSYDADGNPSTMSGTDLYAYGTHYTGIGQLAGFSRDGSTSLTTNYGHDPATGATTQIQQTAQTGSIFTTLSNLTYSYDNTGNVTSVATTSNTLATDTQCFSYDYLQNLTSAWTPSSNNCATAKSSTALGGPAPYWTDYAVSPQTGNRTTSVEHPVSGTATTDTFAYPAAGAANPHAVQSVTHTGGSTGTSTYGYDAAGDTTARPGQTLNYDAEGKAATVTAGSESESESNVYDASGNLLLQTDSTTGSTLFLGATELHEETGSSTASAVRTYSANGTPVAERTTTVGVSGGKLTWLATDAQGTVDMQVDAVTGAVTSRLQDPFGQARGASTAAWSDGHGFLNATTGALTGVTQLGARMYDATLGRFLSVDPVLSPTDPQQNNGYSYAHNDPVSLSDPTGLDPNIASSCSTLACRNGMYTGSSGKTPAAAGNSSFRGLKVEPSCGTPMACAITKPSKPGSGQPFIPDHSLWPFQLTGIPSKDQKSWSDLEGGFIGICGSLPEVCLGSYMKAADFATDALVGSDAARVENTLQTLATDARSEVGPGVGHVYGTKVHAALEKYINALGNDEIHSEVTYLNNDVWKGGNNVRGGVRVDVVVGNPAAPTAIYDLKTGGAVLSPGRIAQIRAQLPPGYENIPIYTLRP